jgi:hypothetical protein
MPAPVIATILFAFTISRAALVISSSIASSTSEIMVSYQPSAFSFLLV